MEQLPLSVVKFDHARHALPGVFAIVVIDELSRMGRS